MESLQATDEHAPLTLSELLKTLSLKRGYDTAWSWATSGVRCPSAPEGRLKLETFKIGQVLYTTLNNYYRFVSQQNPGRLMMAAKGKSGDKAIVTCRGCSRCLQFHIRDDMAADLEGFDWKWLRGNWWCKSCAGLPWATNRRPF